MKTLNQKKKELFELLVQYYDTKPEHRWCTDEYHRDDRSCSIGWLKKDFSKHNWVISTVYKITEAPASTRCNLVYANDGLIPKYDQPTPKQRVLAYLKDEINKL